MPIGYYPAWEGLGRALAEKYSDWILPGAALPEARKAQKRREMELADAVTVPVIASGGCGTLQHLVEGVTLGHASAVAAASLFHFTDQSVIKAKSYMKSAGLDVRPA